MPNYEEIDADTLISLAKNCIEHERYDEVERLYLRALAIRERILGPEHPDIATILTDLAEFYYYENRYIQSEGLYQRVLNIRERVLGLEHPDTLIGLSDLVRFYLRTKRYEEATPLCLRALASRERILGPEHHDTAISLEYMGWLYSAQERYEQASPFYLRAFDIRKKALGPKHPYTLETFGSFIINSSKHLSPAHQELARSIAVAMLYPQSAQQILMGEILPLLAREGRRDDKFITHVHLLLDRENYDDRLDTSFWELEIRDLAIIERTFRLRDKIVFDIEQRKKGNSQ